MREAIRLKKEAFRAWLGQGSPEEANGYRLAKRPKTQVWEEVVEAMEDFWLSSRKFWQTVRRLRKGRQGTHWSGLQPSVKQWGCRSAPPSLKPWFSAGNHCIVPSGMGGVASPSEEVEVSRDLVQE